LASQSVYSHFIKARQLTVLFDWSKPHNCILFFKHEYD
jgi:hypothetical protein